MEDNFSANLGLLSQWGKSQMPSKMLCISLCREKRLLIINGGTEIFNCKSERNVEIYMCVYMENIMTKYMEETLNQGGNWP